MLIVGVLSLLGARPVCANDLLCHASGSDIRILGPRSRGLGALADILLDAVYHSHSHGIYTLALVVVAIACYAMSLVAVTWVVISKVFPNRVRGAAVSIAVWALWIASFMLTCAFPHLNHTFGPAGTFWIYAAVCDTGFLFTIKVQQTETRGKPWNRLGPGVTIPPGLPMKGKARPRNRASVGKAYTGRDIKQIPESVAAWKFFRFVPMLDSARQPDS